MEKEIHINYLYILANNSLPVKEYQNTSTASYQTNLSKQPFKNYSEEYKTLYDATKF